MYNPLDALSILVSTDIVEQGGRGGGSAMDGSGYNVDERIGLGDPRIQAIEQSKGFEIVTPQELFLHDRFGGAKAEINWTTDAGTLTVIPAYRDNDVNFAAFYGGLETVKEEDSQRSLEARFASTEHGMLRWIVGAYYLKDGTNTFLTIDQLNRTGNQQIYGYGTESKAGFADLTFDLTSSFRLIGGIRYTDEVKSIDGSLHNPFLANPKYITLDESSTYKATTYRYGLQYDLTPASMLYAMVATGFHSGGFFFTADNPVFQPETIKAYTLGAKNRFLDHRLQLNMEIFDWEYHNQQLAHTAIDSQGDAIFATQNAGATRIKGVETDVNFQLADHTRVGVNLQ
jgi:iron complex outermembrane recepter protein